jgi:hypothetical protein
MLLQGSQYQLLARQLLCQLRQPGTAAAMLQLPSTANSCCCSLSSAAAQQGVPAGHALLLDASAAHSSSRSRRVQQPTSALGWLRSSCAQGPCLLLQRQPTGYCLLQYTATVAGPCVNARGAAHSTGKLHFSSSSGSDGDRPSRRCDRWRPAGTAPDKVRLLLVSKSHWAATITQS